MSRYQHDCEECKPLGEFEEYDLYFCEQPPEWWWLMREAGR